MADLSNKKILMVIAPKDFRDIEYTEPRRALENAQAKIAVASTKSGEAVGADGAKVIIDLAAAQVNAQNFDAVIFVGGPGMANLVSNVSLVNLAKKFYEAGKVTTAICIAPVILANAGILNGKKATVWEDGKDDLIRGGALYTAAKVEADGKIITANGPAAAAAFGEAVVKALSG